MTLFLEDSQKKIVEIKDNKLQQFVKDYFDKKQKNDYLFFVLKGKELLLGGVDYGDGQKTNEHWIKRTVKTQYPIKHLGAYLTLNFKEL